MNKKLLTKTVLASLVTTLAMFFAQTSTFATTNWWLDQPKIPEKLLKKRNEN